LHPSTFLVGFKRTTSKKETSKVKKTARFVIWICSKFTHCEKEIIQGLIEVLANRNPGLSLKMILKRNILITATSLLS